MHHLDMSAQARPSTERPVRNRSGVRCGEGERPFRKKATRYVVGEDHPPMPLAVEDLLHGPAGLRGADRVRDG